MQLEQKIAKQLSLKKKTVAVAESCTGGLLSNCLTNIPGSSVFFKAGIIAYDNSIKQHVLKVPAQQIKQYGAVSAEVASYMARGVRHLIKTDFGIAITGIAGPTGGSKHKPIGLTYIAICNTKTNTVKRFVFKGNRLQNKTHAKNSALKILFEMLT